MNEKGKKMKKTLKKLLICICIFLTLFNYLGLNSIRVEAANEDSVAGIAESINEEFKQYNITYLVSNDELSSNYSVNIKVGE